jgi:PilZ domain
MSQATVSTERRKKQRKRPLGLVYVELSAANGGMLRDLSEQGFAMRSMLPLRVGDASPFSFSLDPETRLEGQCKVSWIEEDGRVAGFEFTEVGQALPEKIRLWLLDNSYGAAPQTSASPPVNREASTLQELRDEIRTIVPGIHDHKQVVEKQTEPVIDAAQAEAPIPEPIENERPSAFVKMELPDSLRVQAAEDPTPPPEPPPILEPLPTLPEIEVVSEPAKVSSWMDRSMASLAVRMMLFLALVACAFVFHRPLGNAIIWLGTKVAGPAPVEVSPVPVSEDNSSQVQPTSTNPSSSNPGATIPSPLVNDQKPKTEAPAPIQAPAPDRKDIEVPAVTENTSPAPATNPPTNSLVPMPAKNRSATFSPTISSSSEQAGQQEYLAAQEILKSKNPDAGMPEAIRLLWVAVEKGNSSAEVTLAELYWHGTGVTRSCDQTSILLTAAARKGNAVGQKRLEEFQREGCE